MKLDADGPEGAWLSLLSELIAAQQLRIRTLVGERTPRVEHISIPRGMAPHIRPCPAVCPAFPRASELI